MVNSVELPGDRGHQADLSEERRGLWPPSYDYTQVLHRFRHPAELINHRVWHDHQFPLNFQKAEERMLTPDRPLIGMSGRWHGLELPCSMVGQEPWLSAVFGQVVIGGWK